ncbi:MAG: outer membrane protein assembly factor BamD [Polyangiales bacterium]
MVDYPNYIDSEEAHKMIQNCLNLLANHELYVAKFYMRRKAYRAAVSRLDTLLSAYRGSVVDADAMWLLSDAHSKLNEQVEAKKVLEDLAQSYPESEAGKKAADKLRKINAAQDSTARR